MHLSCLKKNSNGYMFQNEGQDYDQLKIFNTRSNWDIFRQIFIGKQHSFYCGKCITLYSIRGDSKPASVSATTYQTATYLHLKRNSVI